MSVERKEKKRSSRRGLRELLTGESISVQLHPKSEQRLPDVCRHKHQQKKVQLQGGTVEGAENFRVTVIHWALTVQLH